MGDGGLGQRVEAGWRLGAPAAAQRAGVVGAGAIVGDDGERHAD
jgi:hypothetical protein